MVKTPVNLEIFKSNPNPKSQAKCLISFKMKKLKDQHIEIIRNFPKFVVSRFTPILKIFSLMLKENIHKQIKINTKKFITPTILWVIDNRDEMCHLYICKCGVSGFFSKFIKLYYFTNSSAI